MKHVLVMAGVGVGLFSATVVGLLAAQGRLDYEGTRGIPLLSMMFSAPPQDPNAEAQQPGVDAEHGDHSTGDHGDVGDVPHIETESHSEPFGVQHDGLGVEEPLGYEIGGSALNPEAPPSDGHGGGHGGGGHGGGHGGDDGHGDEGHAEDGHDHEDQDTSSASHKKLSPPKDDFAAQMEALYGQDRYRRGEFFKFPRLEGDITVDDLNKYLRASKLALGELDSKRSELDAYASELDARQRDIEDRERQVAEQMAAVDRARAELDRRVEEFRSKVLLVRIDEENGLKQYAKTLESFEPVRAMQHVMQSWETEAGRTRILKVLSFMDPKAANALIAQIETDKQREVLVERLKVVHERAKK